MGDHKVEMPLRKRNNHMSNEVPLPWAKRARLAGSNQQSNAIVKNKTGIHSDTLVDSSTHNGSDVLNPGDAVIPGDISAPVTSKGIEDDEVNGDNDFDDEVRDYGGGLPIHAGKPDASSVPMVWANKKPALCDTLPYFRAHQGSVYTDDRKLTGILLDGGGSHRDVFEGHVLVTSVGGGRRRDNNSGKMVHKKDHSDDLREVKAHREAFKSGRPVIVIAGDKHRLYPVKPPHAFCVLGHFVITYMWLEPEIFEGQRVSHWMVKLEVHSLEQPIWWTPPDALSIYASGVGEHGCESRRCTDCQEVSKTIFQQGWVCLNKSCLDYYNVDLDFDALTYSEEFLNERTLRDQSFPLTPLVPQLPSAQQLEETNSFGTEAEFKRGIVCKQCGCCIPRAYWKGWVCDNANCEAEYTLPIRAYPIENVLSEQKKRVFRRSAFASPGILRWDMNIAGQQVECFLLPDPSGTIVGIVSVFRATRAICSKTNGPDDLFSQMQREDYGLKRNAAMCRGSRIEELTSHFASNWGAPYKYGVFVETVALQAAPIAIQRGLAQLQWAEKLALPAQLQEFQRTRVKFKQESMPMKAKPFNELLCLGYFDDSKISYHDDGEKELGPTVGTLSLGSPALMSFRKKLSKSQMKKNKASGNSRSSVRKADIRFGLTHGDMVLMHGTEIHKYYEHQVVPKGLLRFAMTARYIRPELITDPEMMKEFLEKGQLPDNIASLAYEGQP